MQDMSMRKDDSESNHLSLNYNQIENRSSFTIDEQSIYSVVGKFPGEYGPGQDGHGLHVRVNDSSISMEEGAMQRQITKEKLLNIKKMKQGDRIEEEKEGSGSEGGEEGESENDEHVDPDDIIVIDPSRESAHQDVINKINQLHLRNPQGHISQTGALIESIIKV